MSMLTSQEFQILGDCEVRRSEALNSEKASIKSRFTH